MKKAIASLSASLLLVISLSLPAGAVELPAKDSAALYPVDIILDQENHEIRKVYDLNPSTDPSTLPMDDFSRDGLVYSCTDILREVIIGTETMEKNETETVESSKKDLETILAMLPQEREVTTDDGYTGALRLNLDSIKTEVSGYGSSKQGVTATRSYPNLSDADISHLPKTIEDNGRTLTLADVQWQTDNTYNADDYEIGDRYTAICTYSGTKTVSYVKGYTTTADYVGEVHRTGVTLIRYTVIFTGAPDETQAEADAPLTFTLAQIAFAAGGILLLVGAISCGAHFLTKRRKERMSNEEMGSYSDYGHSDNDADGGTGDGAGVSH